MRWISVGSFVLVFAGCAGSRSAPRDLATLRAAPLCALSEREVDTYLRALADDGLTLRQRVALLARQAIGQPYQIHLLGEFPYELHDPQPLYCLSASDCVTFVEHIYAMALAEDWPSFFRTLQRIRYRNGEIGLLTRNHFTEADWNVNNAWLFEDITAQLLRSAARPTRLRIDRSAFFEQFGVKVDLPVQEWSDLFVPRDAAIAALDSVFSEQTAATRRRPANGDGLMFEDGDVVEIVRGPADAPHVGHMGLILHDDHGRPTIVHSAKPAVREELLEAYLRSNDTIRGVKVLRVREDWADQR